MEGDSERYRKHLSYFRWTEAFWGHYFVGRPGLRVRLSVDDDEVDKLGRHLGILNPRTDFVLAVRSFIDCYDSNISRSVVAADRIANSVQSGVPGYLGILGACVLIASRMAADDDYAGNNYYPRFNRDILGDESKQRPKGFEDLPATWDKLRKMLNKRSGQYGILGLPSDTTNTPLRNRPNINPPLSQCLFRRADLDRLDEVLRNWLQLGLDGEHAFAELAKHIKMWPERFTVALSKNVATATVDNDLKAAYVDELQDLLSNIATVSASERTRREDKAGVGVARLRVFPRKAHVGLVYDFALEVHRDDAWEPAEDVRLESGDIIGRIQTIFDDREYRYSGSNPQVFVEEVNGDWVTSRLPRLPAFGRVVIVSTAALSKEIVDFATTITRDAAHPSGDVRILPVMERFSRLTAVSFHFSSKAAENVPLPTCLSRFSQFGRFHIRLVGGLEIGNSFLPHALPSVEAIWEGKGNAPKVYCDEVELIGVESQERLEYELPETASEVGLHIISASDGSKIALSVAAPGLPDESRDAFYIPRVAVYFGPQFMRWVRTPREFKLACRQSGGSNPSALLVQGARTFEREQRDQF